MPTVIDSLVITLGLDPKKLTEGQREAIRSFRKTREEGLKEGKELEAITSRAAAGFTKLRREALGFLGLLVGGAGLKNFITNVTSNDAAVGRLSRTIGTNAETLSVWRGAAVGAGGTAEGTTAAITNLVQEFQQFAITGQSQVVPWFRALGISLADATGKMRPFDAIMLDIASAFSKMDPAKAVAFGRSIGLDEGTINLLLKGRDAVQALVEEQRQLAIVTAENARKAESLAKSWHGAEQAATGLGRTMLDKLSPQLESILDTLKGWFQRANTIIKFGKVGMAIPDEKGEIPGFSARRASAAPAGGVRAKPGALTGGESLGILALAGALQSGEIGGSFNRVTAGNDAFHRGMASRHARGLALDFTVTDPSKAAEVAAQIRAKLASMGINANVIDEYNNPSGHSTAPHIHVSFANAAAAARYAEMTGSGGRRAGLPAGGSSSSSTTSTVSIGTFMLNTPATDGAGVARDFMATLERWGVASQAQGGPM